MPNMNELIVKVTGVLKVEKFKLPRNWDDDRFLRYFAFDFKTKKLILPEPDDLIISPNNDWFSAGWNKILELATGQDTDFFSNSLAQLGTGNDSTAFSDAHTDLQSGTAEWKSMESGYPDTPASGQFDFKVKYLTTAGNYIWEEWAVKETTSDTLWNRGLTGGGASWTKDSTEIWYATATLGKA
jgi:hypothetical protein